MNHLSTTYPIAAKEHRCSACLGVIPRGTQYQNDVMVEGGQIYNWRQCEICGYIMSNYPAKFFEDCNGIIQEGAVQHFLENEFQVPLKYIGLNLGSDSYWKTKELYELCKKARGFYSREPWELEKTQEDFEQMSWFPTNIVLNYVY